VLPSKLGNELDGAGGKVGEVSGTKVASIGRRRREEDMFGTDKTGTSVSSSSEDRSSRCAGLEQCACFSAFTCHLRLLIASVSRMVLSNRSMFEFSGTVAATGCGILGFRWQVCTHAVVMSPWVWHE